MTPFDQDGHRRAVAQMSIEELASDFVVDKARDDDRVGLGGERTWLADQRRTPRAVANGRPGAHHHVHVRLDTRETTTPTRIAALDQDAPPRIEYQKIRIG